MNVLLVEDNNVNALVATAILTAADHDVVHVENGQEALDALGSDRFDVVLMDIHMPHMDGVECTRRIRSRDDGVAEIPIIAVTANVLKGMPEIYLEAGMNEVVAKPIDIKTLIGAVDRWTQQG